MLAIGRCGKRSSQNERRSKPQISCKTSSCPIIFESKNVGSVCSCLISALGTSGLVIKVFRLRIPYLLSPICKPIRSAFSSFLRICLWRIALLLSVLLSIERRFELISQKLVGANLRLQLTAQNVVPVDLRRQNFLLFIQLRLSQPGGFHRIVHALIVGWRRVVGRSEDRFWAAG